MPATSFLLYRYTLHRNLGVLGYHTWECILLSSWVLLYLSICVLPAGYLILCHRYSSGGFR
jgi:hypothetical protein